MSETPRRWWFVGNSGSGKSTYARAVARELDVPCHELDATFHQADWTPIDRDAFVAAVRAFTAGDQWVVDGNYRVARPMVLARADVVVALDLPRWRNFLQVLRRTARRYLRQEELWNGNRERLRQILSWDPQRSIVRWSWVNHRPAREKLAWFERCATERGVPFVRVRSHAEARAALADLTGRPPERFVG